MTPTVGRIVHLVVGPTGEHRPAIIVRVIDAGQGIVNLHVFYDEERDVRGGTEFRKNVPFSFLRPDAAWTWHWPERD